MARKPHKDWAEWDAYLAKARCRLAGRPIANNTRVRLGSVIGAQPNAISIRLHSTDIVVIFEDGSRELRTGGWRTMTTAARIRQYGAPKLGYRSAWSLPFEIDPKDPEPEHIQRTIPKPFQVADPGPEPVKSAEGCLVGAKSEDGLAYIETQWGYGSHECPHCANFRVKSAAWRRAMGVHRSSLYEGYAQMVANLQRFGSVEAWQAAYIDEFRRVRTRNAEHKAWVERNTLPFSEGIIVTAAGEVPLARKRQHLRELAVDKRARDQRARFAAQMKATHEGRQRRRAMVIGALASSIADELDVERQRWPVAS
jgi:hypothetical protein